jgi:hypothetical protein
MSDLTPVLQEMAERANATEMLLPHEIRSAGERRRRRLVVATATCAILGTVAAGLVVSVAGRDAASVDPAGQPTPITRSDSDDRVGIIGPPPPGTPPSGPATGELVAAVELYSSGTWVYADGRIINALRNFGTSDQFRGFVVRQLTPSGVEAMRSFLLDGTPKLTLVQPEVDGQLFVREGGRLMVAQDFKGCGTAGRDTAENWDRCPRFTDPDWLPASAWKDPALRPFVPHSYRVELWPDDPRLSPAEVLPAEAVDLLLGPESPLADSPIGQEGLSRRVATPVARQLADAMDQAGPAYARQEGNNFGYGLPSEGFLAFQTVLPHGGTFCDCG